MKLMQPLLAAILLSSAFSLMALAQSESPANQYSHQVGWRYDFVAAKVSAESSIAPGWTVEVGEGRSQIVVDDDRLFVFAGESEKRKGKSPLVKTRLLCLDRGTGKEIWKRESDPKPRLKGQESFSGATLSPRATPTILGNNIITVSYTGILECVDSKSGELRWEKNLVDLGAVPVQFGFASSPVGDGDSADRFYVTAAGPEGGIYCLTTVDGSTIWKSPCLSFSYATPTFATFGGVKQILVVTRDEILGIAKSTGNQLWRHELKEKGLTNVPSPIILDDGFIMSSQGSKGTSRIDVKMTDGSWQTTERWYARRVQYFYSNWALINPDLVLGVADGLLVALNITDGSIAGKWRGFADGNMARIGNQIFLVDGRGYLNQICTFFDSDGPRMEILQKFRILKARCWTPATIVPEGLLLRGGTKLTLVNFTDQSQSAFKNTLKEPNVLTLKRGKSAAEIDYVAKIFTTFREKGASEAMQLYGQLRDQKPNPLKVADRIELFNAAKGQGLDDLAKTILDHAKEDYPDSEEIKNLAGG